MAQPLQRVQSGRVIALSLIVIDIGRHQPYRQTGQIAHRVGQIGLRLPEGMTATAQDQGDQGVVNAADVGLFQNLQRLIPLAELEAALGDMVLNENIADGGVGILG